MATWRAPSGRQRACARRGPAERMAAGIPRPRLGYCAASLPKCKFRYCRLSKATRRLSALAAKPLGRHLVGHENGTG
jgi:hypothetical protein